MPARAIVLLNVSCTVPPKSLPSAVRVVVVIVPFGLPGLSHRSSSPDLKRRAKVADVIGGGGVSCAVVTAFVSTSNAGWEGGTVLSVVMMFNISKQPALY